MSKKDYELIARSLRESSLDVLDFGLRASNDEINEITKHLRQNMALALASTNPRFDRERFLKACGL